MNIWKSYIYPVQAWIFFRLLFHNCLSCECNCDDQSQIQRLTYLRSYTKEWLKWLIKVFARAGNFCAS